MISNSSPLIHLTRIDKIEYLIEQVKEIIIPVAVYHEVVTLGKELNFLESFIIENYINQKKICIVKVEELDESRYPPLGKGELQALELARQRNEILLLDDKKARNVAHILKIDHQTTIATVFELLLTNQIDKLDYRANIKKLAENSWISADVIQEYLERGEKYGR